MGGDAGPASAGHSCVADTYVIEEARRNLLAKAPDAVEALTIAGSAIEAVEIRLRGSPADESLPLPPKDRPVLAAAIEQRCEALMTGDRTHFGALYGPTVRGVTVHSPRSLAEWILAGRKR